MPELLPIPGPISTADLITEIEEACVSTLQADVVVGDGGTLDVATWESRARQLNGERMVLSAEMPALLVDVQSAAMERLASNTRGETYTVRLIGIAQDQDVVSARRTAQRMVKQGCRAIEANDGATTWLAAGYQVIISNWSVGEPGIADADGDPNLFVCEATVPVTVIVTEE